MDYSTYLKSLGIIIEHDVINIDGDDLTYTYEIIKSLTHEQNAKILYTSYENFKRTEENNNIQLKILINTTNIYNLIKRRLKFNQSSYLFKW